ncbi:MAG: serine hydrolase [Candidatus Poribacteria bacterium]
MKTVNVIPIISIFCIMVIHAVPGTASETASYQGLHLDEFMKTWLVLGPIPVSDGETTPDEEAQKKAFKVDFLVEQGGESGIHPEPDLVQKIGDEEYTWQLVHADNDIVNLVEVYGEKEFVVAYAWAEIEAPEPTKVLLGIGSDDGVKVWMNGELVHENWIGRPVNKDDDLVGVTLQKGKNQLLLKVQNQRFDWGFACRAVAPESLAEKFILTVAMGDIEKIDMLLSHGVDVNIKNKLGLTAFQVAQIQGREDVVKFLLEKGADRSIEMPAPGKLVDSIFEEATQGDSPGAAVLVAKDGEILYQKGFGFANLEEHIPVTPDTKFRIGSITKQFTAAAILKLQEDGLLSVNDPLSKFIPDYPRGDEVTIHHLLGHTSGIHSYTSKPEFHKTVMEEVKPEELIESFKHDEFDFDPGEKWLYDNSGYFLLGYIVEKVSGESFGDYLKSHFFEPLGMKNTGVHSWRLNLENEASGYSYKNGEFHPAMKWDMSQAGGAGALYSTVGDLYRWNEGIFNGKVLSESSLKAAFTPVKLNDGSEANAMGAKYGYGWLLSEVRGLKQIGHSGGFDGFNAYLTRYPEQNFTVAVLTNCLPPRPPKEGSVGLISAAAAQAIAYFYLWEQMDTIKSLSEDTTVTSDVYDDYVGRYDYGTYGGILTVTREGDKLFAQMTGQPKIEIFPRSENEFFWKVVDAQITFVRNEEGEVVHAIHRQGGLEIKAPKLKDEQPAEVNPTIYDAYVGQYDFGRAVLTVTKENNRLFAQMTGQPEFEIFPRSENEFFWKVVNAQITFVKDDNGDVTKAIYRQGDIKMEVAKIK